MLLLNVYKPTANDFKSDAYVSVNNVRQLHKKGILLEKYRKIIRVYEIK